MILEGNIAPNTLIGKIEIPQKIYDNENAYSMSKYSRAGEFVENLMSDNIIEFCKRWLHLAGFYEFLADWNEYCRNYYIQFSNDHGYNKYNMYEEKLYYCPIINVPKNFLKQPIYFSNKAYNPIILFNEMKSGGVDKNVFKR